MLRLVSVLVVSTFAASVAAQTIELDFEGNGGAGLLPGNEIGAATPVGMGVSSPAIGGETGSGLLYDLGTNVLEFSFEFSGLTGGLADAASGIHFHLIDPTSLGSGETFFDGTGPITFNLNSGADANVTLATPTIAVDGSATGGSVSGSATLTEDQEASLLAGAVYLNIHSGEFGGGELRGNLVVIPEPMSVALLALVGGVFACGRRR